MKNTLVVLLATVMLFAVHLLMAQPRFAIELRPGVSFATQELGDADLKTGLGFEGMLSYRFTNTVGAYAGWGWNRFSADQSFAGADADFEETGYLFGVQFNPTLGDGALGLYLRAGALVNHIEVENKGGDIISDSGHGLGYQLGAGLDVGLGSNWQLRPGLKYQSLSRDLEIETTTTPVDLRYFSIAVGIAKNF
jgi:opacity protein-like surface antigen